MCLLGSKKALSNEAVYALLPNMVEIALKAGDLIMVTY